MHFSHSFRYHFNKPAASCLHINHHHINFFLISIKDKRIERVCQDTQNTQATDNLNADGHNIFDMDSKLCEEKKTLISNPTLIWKFVLSDYVSHCLQAWEKFRISHNQYSEHYKPIIFCRWLYEVRNIHTRVVNCYCNNMSECLVTQPVHLS